MDWTPDDHKDDVTNPRLDDFAHSYAIVNDVRVFTWGEDLAVMDKDLYRGLCKRVPEPVFGRVGGLTYQFKPVEHIPAESVAVPEDSHNGSKPETLLVQK
jgi:hypothetical protein